jgi:glycosyltransferase involved in cell wall biosynthesis
MRILMINYEFPPLGGGGGVASYEIAKALSARDHEVDVLTTKWPGSPDHEVVDGLTVYRAPVLGRADLATASLVSMLSFLPMGIARGRRLVADGSYDILNTHFAIPSGPTGAALSRLSKIPHVLTIIGGDIYDPSKRLSPGRNPFLAAAVRRVLNSSTQVIAISEDIKRRAREDLGCRSPIEVIHYGLTPPRFDRKSRQELGIPEDSVVLISIGRLIRRKAFDTLLQAVARVREPRLRVLVIGEGPEQARLEGLSQSLGLSARVEFLGAIWGERKFQYLSAADMFVLSSLHEGFGLVFLEAMYCGLPVVASASGGQTDFLRDGETGFLTPVGDTEALADRIARLTRDEALRRRMGEFNREYARRFNIAGVAERYESLFLSVIERTQRSAGHTGADQGGPPRGGGLAS